MSRFSPSRTYLSHLRKLQMYRPTAECRDIKDLELISTH